MSSRIAVIGGNGQVGRALRNMIPEAHFYDRNTIDLAHPETIDNVDWPDYDTVINTAAYTQVDKAETETDLARKVNGTSVGVLAERVSRSGGTVIHFSTDYVFDGIRDVHSEDEDPNPLSVYGTSKLIGDRLALAIENTYVIRTSWVVGDGNNFVRTMLRLARDGINPSAITDQHGRLAFADQLAEFAVYLDKERPVPGIYNLSAEGRVSTWFVVARLVFRAAGHDETRVSEITTAEYFKDKPHAERPVHSTFDLSKAKATGFKITEWEEKLVEYIDKELSK